LPYADAIACQQMLRCRLRRRRSIHAIFFSLPLMLSPALLQQKHDDVAAAAYAVTPFAMLLIRVESRGAQGVYGFYVRPTMRY